MNLYQQLQAHTEKIAVVGLGYVGMPLAVEFAKHFEVIGFDISRQKIMAYREGKDPTNEVGDEAIASSTVDFTFDEERLSEASFFVIAVPTPVNQDKTPNLNPVESASRLVGKHLKAGSVVVFESTVYPGVTEDVCVPILAQESGLIFGDDFKVGYSPERINPGDQVHRLTTITKVISGSDEDALGVIKQVYDEIIEIGTYPVSSIRCAEAIKVVENSQRDINIAFMNELAMVFDRMGIDTAEVVAGMNTKWNALGFAPGLVGGHCIGVDPYYFTYEAERLGYHSQIILAGRKVNDGMGSYIADAAVKQMTRAGKAPATSKVTILGLTFKEDCPDVRNTKVADILDTLCSWGVEAVVVDPCADANEAKRAYGVDLVPLEKAGNADCVIVAVAHESFRALGFDGVLKLFRKDIPNSERVLIDVKSIFDLNELKQSGIRWWRL